MNELDNYIGAIIKPDSIKEWVDRAIYEDILKDWFKVKIEKIMQIQTRQVPYIYPDKVNIDRYPFSHYSVTHWPSIILLLEKKDSYNSFSKLKWSSFNKWGIREKYRKKTKEELEKEWMSWPELEYELCKNKIHGSDDIKETILMLSWLLNTKEINEIWGFSNLLYMEVLKQLTKNKQHEYELL